LRCAAGSVLSCCVSAVALLLLFVKASGWGRTAVLGLCRKALHGCIARESVAHCLPLSSQCVLLLASSQLIDCSSSSCAVVAVHVEGLCTCKLHMLQHRSPVLQCLLLSFCSVSIWIVATDVLDAWSVADSGT
jgi:hypothetical protein